MSLDGFIRQQPDADPAETKEWVDALDAVVDSQGPARARLLVAHLNEHARNRGIGVPEEVSTPYLNTIAPANESWFPGDEQLERRIRAMIRWNAAVMVVRANRASEGIGGHLSTFASSAALVDVGMNWFFRGKADGTPGDHVYLQGHAAPGIYARSFLEGRLTAEQLDHFRRELSGPGLPSYPHPRLMPDYWEYPTVSMGLGAINSIYQARFLRYMENRRIDDTSTSRVWAFVGDGETDEPETLGSISLAAREGLDNLVWVVNCNLQRLDGPVRGNGKIIQELEAVFRGAGWNVIKVVWGSAWDQLLAADVDGVLVDRMNRTPDGDFQRYAVSDGAHIREHFFGPDPRLRKLVEHLSDEELRQLPRGGHDYRKLFAAYAAATQANGQPTAILAKTVKGWTLGPEVESRNATHQIKKMTSAQLVALCRRLHLEHDIDLAAVEAGEAPYLHPGPESPEVRYLLERRRNLDGPIPSRPMQLRRPMPLPPGEVYGEYDAGSGTQVVTTTAVFTRLLRNLMRNPDMGRRVVPIVPDEARTFGMDALFREFEIYAHAGQRYEPVDHDLLLSYVEDSDGQILEEGITEAGSMASWTAAGTAHANRGVPMIPFFIFYSMFGFQRVGDLIWAAADARARGFLVGATAGRTTLPGEGLQHADGHSHVLASVVPTCRAYDPSFAYEFATIVRRGIERMYGTGSDETGSDGRGSDGRGSDGRGSDGTGSDGTGAAHNGAAHDGARTQGGLDEFYYLTVYNEPWAMPARPDGLTDDDILAGIYRFAAAKGGRVDASILFSGSAYAAAAAARDNLATRHGVHVDLWSVPGWKQVREEALDAERWSRLHPAEPHRLPRITHLLSPTGMSNDPVDMPDEAPVVAVSDFLAAVPDGIGRFMPVGRSFTALGTDGFGRSDDRPELRRFFEVDAAHIEVAVLSALARSGQVNASVVADAIAAHGIDTDAPSPRTR
jgi:pyruvate dehydrogenase E1 component